jgi:molybdopterin-containing oxidoreductase family membrane subunit
MFIISAVAGGVSLTLLATMVAAKLRNTSYVCVDIQREISRVVGYVLLAYLYLKLWDWAATSYYSQTPGSADVLARLNATTPFNASFWWLEIILGGVVPVLLLLIPRTRRDDRAVMLALGLVVLGVVVNRWNTTLIGLVAPPDWSPGVLGGVAVASYLPTLPEVAVAIGIVAYGLLFFTLGTKYLPIYTECEEEPV